MTGGRKGEQVMGDLGVSLGCCYDTGVLIRDHKHQDRHVDNWSVQSPAGYNTTNVLPVDGSSGGVLVLILC